MNIGEDQQGQDDDEENGGDREEPIYQHTASSQYQSSDPRQPPIATSTIAPPAGIFIPPQPPKPYNVRLQPNLSQSFSQQQRDGNSYQEVPSVPQGLYNQQSIPAIQSASRTYFPRAYQQVPENSQGVVDGSDDDNNIPAVPPPPPPPPCTYNHPSPYNVHTGYFPLPWIPPTPFTSAMPLPPHNSYMGYPPFQYPTPTAVSGVQQPSFYPSPYTFPWLPHNISATGVSPMYPPFDPMASSGSAAAGIGGYTSHGGLFGPSSHHPSTQQQQHMMAGGGGGYGVTRGSVEGEGGDGRAYSPSGVTGVSMQVQPPSSPPSAPSLSNIQQHTTSSIGDNNTGIYMHLYIIAHIL